MGRRLVLWDPPRPVPGRTLAQSKEQLSVGTRRTKGRSIGRANPGSPLSQQLTKSACAPSLVGCSAAATMSPRAYRHASGPSSTTSPTRSRPVVNGGAMPASGKSCRPYPRIIQQSTAQRRQHPCSHRVEHGTPEAAAHGPASTPGFMDDASTRMRSWFARGRSIALPLCSTESTSGPP